MQISSSSDEDVKPLDVKRSAEIDQGYQDDDGTPLTPPRPSSLPPKKKQRFEVQYSLPAMPQQLGMLNLITTLRADTSFDGGIWAQADGVDQKGQDPQN